MYLPLLALLFSGWPAARTPLALGRTFTPSALQTTTAHSSFAQTDWVHLSADAPFLPPVKREAPQPSDVTLSDILSGTATGPIPGAATTTSGTPSPSSSTTPNTSSNASALPLAQSLLTASGPSCLSPGGGCAVLNLTLPQCLDDTCACADETTLAAMVCTQCNVATSGSTEGVAVYNTYLGLCEQMGIAAPSDTLVVSMAGAAQTNGGASGSADGTASATASDTATGTIGSVVLAGLQPTASATSVSGGGATNIAGPAAVSPVPPPSNTETALGASVSSSSAQTSQNEAATPSSSASFSSGGPAVGLVTAMPTPAAPYVVGSTNGTAPEVQDTTLSPSDDVLAGGLEPSRAAAGIQLDTRPPDSALAVGTSRTAVALLATEKSGLPDSTILSPDTTVTASPLGSGPAPSDTASELSSGGLSASGGIDSSSENTLTSTPAMVLPSAGSASVSGAAGIQVDSIGNSSTANSTTTAALDASAAFFGFTIDSKCDSDCGEWKTLAGTCTQDACICTDAAVLSAGACSSCLGSTTHGETYQQQIGFYNAFTANCSLTLSGSSLPTSGTTGQYAYEDVPAATSRSGMVQGGSGSTRLAVGQASGTVAAAGEVVETKYVDSGGRIGAVVPTGWTILMRLVVSAMAVVLAGAAV